MNAKLSFSFVLSLLLAGNFVFSSNNRSKSAVEDGIEMTTFMDHNAPIGASQSDGVAGSPAQVQKIAPPYWLEKTGYLKRELEIFNACEPNLQILLKGLLGTQIVQKRGGLQMFYPDNKRVYDLVIDYLEVVGDDAILDRLPLLGKNLLEYAIANNNGLLFYELKERLADKELQKRIAVKELEKELTIEKENHLKAIPQL